MRLRVYITSGDEVPRCDHARESGAADELTAVAGRPVAVGTIRDELPLGYADPLPHSRASERRDQRDQRRDAGRERETGETRERNEN